METFWTVWNPARAIPQVRHATPELATREAERLARIQPNDAFYVMQAIRVSQHITVVTRDLEYHPL